MPGPDGVVDWSAAVDQENDALPAVDSECSGRKRCEVIVSNKVFRRVVPGACMSALSGYARIAYTCVDGKDVLHELIKRMI